MAVTSAAIALALLLPVPAIEAQNFPNWRRPAGPPGIVGPPQAIPPGRRVAPQLPNYYLERGGPVIAPNTPPTGPADVANSLRARGFNNIGPVERRGATSITEAVGPGGERVQLVIGPNGEIVGARVLRSGGQ